jgi:RND family efflux transporter MFP subunit
MSAKTARSFTLFKVLLVFVFLTGAGYAAYLYLRPVAKVVAVMSGDAEDAKPGSVDVREEYSMQMKSQIAGRVLNQDYKLETGMHVKSGDVLVKLDTGDIQIEIDQLQNDYNSSKLRIATGSPATFALESAKSDFINIERLFKLGQISDSDRQKARRGVETIEQQLALEKVRNEEDLASDENALKAKQRELEKMTIRVPDGFDGDVSAVFAHPGDLIEPGSPIVSLITTSRIVEAKISEEDFADIKVGQKVLVKFLPYHEWLYNGTVTKILPTADPVTQRHLVDLNITDIDKEKLIPGITGEVSIVVGAHHADAIIPRRALSNESVYVVRDGKVELRRVKKGYIWLTGAEILEGLKPGELVIVDGLDGFRDGDAVRTEVLPPDAFAVSK